MVNRNHKETRSGLKPCSTTPSGIFLTLVKTLLGIPILTTCYVSAFLWLFSILFFSLWLTIFPFQFLFWSGVFHDRRVHLHAPLRARLATVENTFTPRYKGYNCFNKKNAGGTGDCAWVNNWMSYNENHSNHIGQSEDRKISEDENSKLKQAHDEHRWLVCD